MSGVLGRVRDEVRALSPYKVVGHVGHEGATAIRLDANESPWPLPAQARARIAEVVAAIDYHRYPDIDATELRRALARRLGAQPNELVLGVGSDEVIAVIVTALARPGARLLVPDPTFSMFVTSGVVAGLTPIRVPLDGALRLDVPAMLAAIARERPAVIFLATPNNPTGLAYGDADLEAIVRAAPDALVVIDEAYAPFSGSSRASWVDRFENVGVMGTLSKIGLAACRLGWIRVRPELAAELDKVRLPYDLPTPSQAIGALMLGELASVIDAHVAAIVEARSALGDGLARFFTVHPSDANFFLVSHPHAAHVHAELATAGILVRAWPGHPRLGDALRITVGTPDENRALLDALAQILG